jgi:hypothetical protein
MQSPLTQLAPAPQAFPHSPQFAVSVSRFTQTSLHAVEPFWHVQLPSVQSWPALQVTPHAPQFASSL